VHVISNQEEEIREGAKESNDHGESKAERQAATCAIGSGPRSM